MEQILADINKANEELVVLNTIDQEKFKVINAENIDDYLHHYEAIASIQMKINSALLSYLRLQSK